MNLHDAPTSYVLFNPVFKVSDIQVVHLDTKPERPVVYEAIIKALEIECKRKWEKELKL